jgi:hypothetical protein
MTTTRARRLPFLLLSAGLILALAAAASADAPDVRRPGEPMIVPMELGAAERAHVLDRARALTGALGIPGEAAEPHRAFEALDRVVVDEVAVRDGDGRATAVIRTDAGRGDVRSLVRLDWSHDADRALVDERTVPGHARHFAMLAGITTPDAPPDVAWDDAMRAWRVSWSRTIDGFPVAGDGLTVWVYRGGQLAALKRIETPAAAAPLVRVGPDVAVEATRGWAERAGIPSRALTVTGAPELAWVRPNDFVTRGGADDTDAGLRLVFRVELEIRAGGGVLQRVILFVDAGTGALVGGAESA